MNGMNATTGTAIDGTAHLAQSIADILFTPLGSRVMRRDYGSLLFFLLDQPINAALRMLVHAATALSIKQWEPRISITSVTMSAGDGDGAMSIQIEGTRTDLPAPSAQVSLSIPVSRAN